MMSERTRVPGYFIGPFVHAMAAAPWLTQMKATTLAQVHPPSHEPAELVGPPGPTFSSSYLASLTAARSKIATYQEILTGDSTLPASLEQLILLAEAGQFTSQEYLGEQFLNTVGSRLNQQFRQIAPDPESTWTLTQQSGNIAVPIHNLSGRAVKVRIQLESPGNRLLVHDNSRLVTIPGDGLTLTFGVQARTTGRFPVQVLVTTPDGTTTLSRGRLVVRSTAYNRVALVITIGAALFLLALWARRFLPWTKR